MATRSKNQRRSLKERRQFDLSSGGQEACPLVRSGDNARAASVAERESVVVQSAPLCQRLCSVTDAVFLLALWQGHKPKSKEKASGSYQPTSQRSRNGRRSRKGAACLARHCLHADRQGPPKEHQHLAFSTNSVEFNRGSQDQGRELLTGAGSGRGSTKPPAPHVRFQSHSQRTHQW